jgi:hypothetical protein
MSQGNGNGAAPEPSEAGQTPFIREEIARLTEARDAASRVAAKLRNEYDAALEATKAYGHAIDALAGIGADKPVKPKKRTGNGHGKHNWQASEESIEKVLAAMKAWPEETCTQTQLTQAASLAPETVRRAVDALRERELVRVAGTTRGGGKLLALMPDVERES